eukprot:COSAG01_NODE_12916_length_1664_cov_0.948882_3_plen_50_part_01
MIFPRTRSCAPCSLRVRGPPLRSQDEVVGEVALPALRRVVTSDGLAAPRS